MGIASLFGLTGRFEPVLWLLIFVFYAYIIARRTSKWFLHGFLVSLVNGIWIAIIHSAFFSTYMENNPDMMAGYQKLPQFVSPQAMMLIMGPLIGAGTGLVAGLFAFIAGKLLAPKMPQ